MFALVDTAVVNAVTRRERVNGREYLVAPVSLLVPGVLSGSKGPLYYPPEEVARNVDDWEGMPLTIGHPRIAGQPVSAKHPSVTHVGRVRAPSVRGQSLRAEGWFDVEAVRYEDLRLLQRLERGDRIEVSTGLYTTNEPAEPGASYKGRGYDFIAKDYRPDHLAILTDEQGACSLRDGCGVNNSATDDDEFARVASYFNLNLENPMNSLNDRERMDVMPTLNCDCDHLFDTGATDDDDAPRREPAPQRLGNELTANDDQLNAILFGGSNFAN